MTQIKICGLSTAETVDAAVDAGASHIGLVHYEPSPRHVSLETAAKLRARVPPSTKVVLLSVRMEPNALETAYRTVRPDILQFHGSETIEWMEAEEAPADEVDLKLWEGAADEGWRMLLRYHGSGAKNNWIYLAPCAIPPLGTPSGGMARSGLC